jgi:hypothetical protein
MFTQLCDNTETTLGGNILCGKIAFICVPAEGTPVGDSVMTEINLQPWRTATQSSPSSS